MNATALRTDPRTAEQRAAEDVEAAIERAAQQLSASHLYAVVARAVAQHGRPAGGGR